MRETKKGADQAPAEAQPAENPNPPSSEPVRALARREPADLSPVARVILTEASVKAATEARKLVAKFIKANMVEGEDYGWAAQDIDPKNRRKEARRVLMKPGAEKLLDLFEAMPVFKMAKEIEDHTAGLFFYRMRCRAVHRSTGTVLNEGMGSASSYESKYRYRTADRVCPNCGGAFIKRSKFSDRDAPGTEPGWYCFQKLGGCGAQFVFDAPAITEQAAGKIQNPDLADVANTVLKMAEKRAKVDCAIGLARCSDMFTQDIEDEAAPTDAKPAAAPQTSDLRSARQQRAAQGTAPAEAAPPAASGQPTTRQQRREAAALAAAAEARQKAEDEAAAKAKPAGEQTVEAPKDPPKPEPTPAPPAADGPPKSEGEQAMMDPAYAAMANGLIDKLEAAKTEADLTKVAAEIQKLKPNERVVGRQPGRLLKQHIEELRLMWAAKHKSITGK